MAPEIINEVAYNEKVDIWAVSVIAYMLIAGELPFVGESEEEVKSKITLKAPVYTGKAFKKVSKAAITFLKRGLDKDPN